MRVVVLVCVAAATTSVSAQTNAPPPESTEKPASDFWTRKTLTGDWGGARKELEEKGIGRLSDVHEAILEPSGDLAVIHIRERR